MNRERQLGVILLATASLIGLATLLSPFPSSPYSVAADVAAHGTIDATRLRIATGDGEIHSYDEANDTTYLFIAYCSHQVCGPVAAVKGDLRGAGGIQRGAIVDPVDDTVSLVAAPPLDENISRDSLGVRDASKAYSSLFVVRSPWPAFLPRLAALTLAVAGLALIVRPRYLSALPSVLGAGVALAVARAPMGIILAQLAVVPLVLAAAIAAVIAAARKRSGWGAAGILWFAVVMLGASFLAFFHFPPPGSAGD